MSKYIDDPTHCEPFQEDLTEFALGILSGRRRSEVLSHVENCPQCSSELEQLSLVADTILQLTPEIEPPLGFESRLAQRLHVGAGARRPDHYRRTGLFAMAAAILLVLGVGIGALASRGSSNPGPSAQAHLTSASLTARGHVVGEVFVSAGQPSWMFMAIDGGSWSGAVTCELILAGGRVEKIGRFTLTGGYGAWGAPFTTAAGQVRGARLIAANGTILATAYLPV